MPVVYRFPRETLALSHSLDRLSHCLFFLSHGGIPANMQIVSTIVVLDLQDDKQVCPCSAGARLLCFVSVFRISGLSFMSAYLPEYVAFCLQPGWDNAPIVLLVDTCLQGMWCSLPTVTLI